MATLGGLPEAKHLDGTNYGDWKFWMKNFLIDAGLWRCIAPREGQEIDLDLDLRALAKINLSLKPCAAKITKKCETAKAAWDALQGEYESTGVVRLIGLYSTLFKTRFDSFSSIQQYVHHILSICEQLESTGQPFADNVVGGIILGGLPDEFRPLILGIQGSKQSTSIEFVKSLLLQDNLKDIGINSVSAYATNKTQSSSTGAKGPRCYECHEYGHIRANCDKRKHAKKSSTKHGKQKQTTSTNFAALSLTTPAISTDWFLDSGATAHLTSNRNWLKEFAPESNKEVGIANGTKLFSTGSGVVSILLQTGCTMDAQDVLHVPDLSLNLLSVHKIVRHGRSVIFDKNGCRIVDKELEVNSKCVLGTATQVNGMYRLDCQQPSSFVAETSGVTTNLWHCRLGHLNHSSMQLLHNKMATGLKVDKIVCAM